MEIFILSIVSIIVFVGIIALLIYVIPNRHYRKMRKIYDTIQVGDRYQFNLSATNPFDKPRTFTATIIAKVMAGKYPWVQYRYDDGSISQDELDEFLACHEKIN